MDDLSPDEVFADMIAARVIARLNAAPLVPALSGFSRVRTWLKGKKTVIAALMLAALPPVAEYLYKIDWQTFGISPGMAVAVSAAVIALRAISTGPIGGDPKPPPS